MTDETTRQVHEALEYAALIWSRYREHGKPGDLKAATGTYRRILASAAVVSTLPHEAQAARSNLALALIAAFELTGELRYLDEALDLSSTALELEPEGTGRVSILNAQHVARMKRFAATRQQADLDGAAAAVEAMERIGPDDPATLLNRAALLTRRFDDTGSLEALDEAIATLERCAATAPAEHRAAALGSLADALVERYRLRRRGADIDGALEAERQTLALLPADAPVRRDHLLVLGNILLAQYDARRTAPLGPSRCAGCPT